MTHNIFSDWELISASLTLTERINDKSTREEEKKDLIQYREEIRAELKKRRQEDEQ